MYIHAMYVHAMFIPSSARKRIVIIVIHDHDGMLLFVINSLPTTLSTLSLLPVIHACKLFCIISLGVCTSVPDDRRDSIIKIIIHPFQGWEERIVRAVK